MRRWIAALGLLLVAGAAAWFALVRTSADTSESQHEPAGDAPSAATNEPTYAPQTPRAQRAGRVETVRPDAPEEADARIGRVVDAAGRPVAGAHVHSARKRGWWLVPPDAITGEDGSFPLARISEWAIALLPGRDASPWVRVDPAQGDVVLRLGASGTVEGTVRDTETQSPVAGIAVAVVVYSHSGDFTWRTRTDDAGAFRIGGLPLGEPLLAGVVDEDRWRPRRGEVPDSSIVDPDDARAAGLLRELATPGEVWRCDLLATCMRGVMATFGLSFPPGTPPPEVADVRHAWEHAAGSVTRSGRVEVDACSIRASFRRYLRAGRHDLEIRVPGFLPLRHSCEVLGDGAPLTIDLNLHREPAGRVIVRVLGPDGAPLAREGLTVRPTIRHDSAWSGRSPITTDAGGRADLTPLLREESLPDDATLSLAVDGEGLFRHDPNTCFPEFEITLRELRALRAARGDDDVVLEVRTRTSVAIELRTVEGRGKQLRPVGEVVVDAIPPECFAAPAFTTDAQGIATVHLVSEVAGRRGFDAPSLVARAPHVGRWNWAFFRNWDPDAWSDEGFTTQDGRAVATMHVRRARVVRCMLVEDGGGPIAGATAKVGRGSDAATVRTDDSGRFDVTLPETATTVSLRLPGWIVARGEIPPAGGDVVLRAWRERTLRVVVANVPQEVGSASVRIEAALVPDSFDWNSVKSLQDAGAERTTALTAPVHDVDVVVESADRKWRAAGRASAGADVVTLTLGRVDEAPVLVVVTDGRGAPVVGRIVSLGGKEFTRPTRTDETGTARWSIPVGRHTTLRVAVEGLGADPDHVDLDVPRAGPLAVTACPEVDVIVRPAATRAGSRRVTVAQVLPDGTRLLGWNRGSSWTEGHETVTLRLRALAASSLEVTIDGKSFTWAYDPAKPETNFEAKLD